MAMNRIPVPVLLVLAVGSLFGSTAPQAAFAADALDWPYWRGPESNGISRQTGLIDDWDPKGGPGSNVKWKNESAGSRSTPIVMNGKIYFLARSEPETPREGERVVCLNAETGEQVWENRFNVWSSDVPDTRVGWSSVVGDPETGNVYALGVCGYFQCLEGETGKTIWSVPMHERFGLLTTYGGRTNFPVVHEDLVIISGVLIGWGELAKPCHRFIGFDKRTGMVVWMNGTRLLPDDTTYSSPTLAVLGGRSALVAGAGDGGIWCFEPRTGRAIWKYPFSLRGINTSPTIVDETVYAGHSEENIQGTKMGAMAAFNGARTGDVTDHDVLWKAEEMMIGKSSPLYWDGRLYCFDDSGKLQVVDAATGQPIGRRITLGTMMRGSPLFADGKIYIAEANGRWYILAPDDQQGAQILKRGRLPAGEECHAAPICSHGRIYLMTTGGLYCLEDPSRTPSLTAAPPAAAEADPATDQRLAHIQIVPAELLVKPGEKVQFAVRAFNSRGQRLPVAAAAGVTFAVDAHGAVDAAGAFAAAADAAHVACYVTAKAGDFTSQARVRIVPDLPWKFDFEGLRDLPETWVGARYRHVIRPVDGNAAAVKITTIPKGTRSRCSFGPSDLHDYTIQADVSGSVKDGELPDIGLIAQGYTLDMQGQSQKLQIRSWDPQLSRLSATVDFPWQPNQWYTIKLRAETQGEQAVVSGKVWQRGAAEPAEWQVVATDSFPQHSGSPGLFGNATNAEITIDNVTVTPNATLDKLK